MNLYVWNGIGGITDNYHDGGGLMIIAEDLAAASELLRGVTPLKDFPKPPDLVRECNGPSEIKVFPNAGCC